ncbi:carboxypeptidase M32 [Anaerococcus vaginimassiliensis]|uniref:carboxypeptidase M32 n=1 Tax=Anaerococcus vaginimassiliensis TaxID=2042308 RepID=UPI0013EF099B|nr:carboxypeptidase M32 [Anaerococcus vaginimassiliensis]
MNLKKEELTDKEVAEIIEARYASESPRKLSEEDKKVVEERLKKIEEYRKKMNKEK